MSGESFSANSLAERLEQKLGLLTTRERQVYDGLAHGRSNKEIAADLEISPRTVEVFRAHVMTKMEASSLSDLLRMDLSRLGYARQLAPGADTAA